MIKYTDDQEFEMGYCVYCYHFRKHDKGYYCNNPIFLNSDNELNIDNIVGLNRCKYFEYDFMSAVACHLPLLNPSKIELKIPKEMM